MTTYQTMRKRGLIPTADIPREKIRKDKQRVRDPPLNGDDGVDDTLNAEERKYYKSPLAYVLGRAVCDEAYYIKKAYSMTTHAIKEL